MKNGFVVLFLIILLSGCEVLNTNNTITLSSLEAQFTQIQEFVKSGNCDEASSCNFMAIGSKACGGPSAYIIFSENVDVEALKKMVDRYTEDQRTYNIEINVISDCSLVNPPQNIDCQDGTCVEIN